MSKIRDLTSLPKSVATHLFKELTGDETQEVNLAAKERQAAMEQHMTLASTFIKACGKPEIIADLRGIANAARKGSTCFAEFWTCTQEELDAMIVAADERRHGGVVAFLSEVISHRQLYERVEKRFYEKKMSAIIASDARLPSQRLFEFQFWPTNEHVRTALQFTGRFPLKLQLQVRNLRKDHAHSYYCAKQKKLAQAWIHKFRDFATCGQPDDKANGTVGKLSIVTSSATCITLHMICCINIMCCLASFDR